MVDVGKVETPAVLGGVGANVVPAVLRSARRLDAMRDVPARGCVPREVPMRGSATTVFVFSLYLWVLGLTLVVVPNALLGVFRIAETHEVWIRVVGMLVLVLAYYYSLAARRDLKEFFRWTVVARTGVLLFFLAFVVAGLAPPVLILFGLIDFAAAGWTAVALRGESRTSAG
jgi:hypothetical protein